MTTAPDIATRVAAGAAYLDQHDPGWWTLNPPTGSPISLEHLRMSDGCRCILGQRCPLELSASDRYGRMPYVLWGSHLSGIEAFTAKKLNAWAVPLGFQAAYFDPMDDDQENIEYEQLACEWANRITARRRAAALDSAVAIVTQGLGIVPFTHEYLAATRPPGLAK